VQQLTRQRIGLAVEVALWLALAPLLLTLRSFSWLPVGLLAVLVAARRWVAADVLPKPVRAPLLLWLPLLALSLVIAIEPDSAWPRGWAYAFGVVTLSVVWNLANISRDKRLPWVVLALWLLVYLAIAVFGLLITSFQYDKLVPLGPIYDMLPVQLVKIQNSAMTQEGLNPNVLAGTLLPVVFVPVGLLIGLQAKQTHDHARKTRVSLQISLGVLTLLLAAAILLTQSRSSYVGLLIGAFAFMALWQPRVLVVLPIFAAAALLFQEQLLSAAATLDWDALASGRPLLWQRATYLVQDFLFTGTGLNMFAFASKILYPELLGLDPDLIHAHNMYLQLLLDFGIFGLLACIWLMLRLWVNGIRATSAPNASPLVIWTIRGLLASQAAWLAFGLTDYANLGSKQGFLFWAAWGLILVFSAPWFSDICGSSGPGAKVEIVPTSNGLS
jgi:O-antigen ligase